MSKFIDLTNKKFNYLTIIKRVENDHNDQTRWLCRCDCGNKTIVLSYCLKNGNTKSCGCLQKKIIKKIMTKHGYNTRQNKNITYSTWQKMRNRCLNQNNNGYKNYGGRGIKICQRWSKFENFLEDMGDRPTNKHQIDRIDNDGDYCKSNCRWVLQKDNLRNTRRNILFVIEDQELCLQDWCKKYDIKRHIVEKRLKNGWNIKKALSTPTETKLIKFNRQTKSLKDFCSDYNLPYQTIRRRINIYKWSITDALTTPVRKQKLNKRK